MTFVLSLAAAGIAAWAITGAARARRRARSGREETCFEVIGGPLDGLRIPNSQVDGSPLADDELLALTVTDSGDCIVSTRATREATAQALHTIAHRMETGGDGGDECEA